MDKKNKILAAIGGVLVLVICAVFMYTRISESKQEKLYSVNVKQGDISEKINLTGQVKASQGIDLAFESSGRIVANYVKTGDKIYYGQALMSIDSSILQAQLKQAEAALAALNIATVQSKTDSALKTAYSSSLGSVQKSVTVAKNTLLVLTDIQYSHFLSQTNENLELQNIKAKAVKSLLGQNDAGTWTSQSLATLNGGAFGLVDAAVQNPTNENIDAALASTATALEDVKNFVNAIPISSALTATERASIVAEKGYISAEIITISNSIQAISAQKVNNDATITTTNSQIDAARANIQALNTQISKTTLRALFNGTVDKDDVIVGAIVAAGTPVVTISNQNLEIQTNIPEVEIANVKPGSKAEITLDAFGTGQVFGASVVSVDSAPTIENGIAVYKARLKFTDANQKIKAGMTANVTIMPETHSNALIIPVSALIQKDGKYFVIVNKGNGQKEAREITIGLKNTQEVEIISGLNLGEKVLAY